MLNVDKRLNSNSLVCVEVVEGGADKHERLVKGVRVASARVLNVDS